MRWCRFETGVFRMQANTVTPQPVFLRIHFENNSVNFVIYWCFERIFTNIFFCDATAQLWPRAPHC